MSLVPQDWGLGVLFVKILYAGTLTGPDWHFKRVLEQVLLSYLLQLFILHSVVQIQFFTYTVWCSIFFI